MKNTINNLGSRASWSPWRVSHRHMNQSVAFRSWHAARVVWSSPFFRVWHHPLYVGWLLSPGFFGGGRYVARVVHLDRALILVSVIVSLSHCGENCEQWLNESGDFDDDTWSNTNISPLLSLWQQDSFVFLQHFDSSFLPLGGVGNNGVLYRFTGSSEQLQLAWKINGKKETDCFLVPGLH